MKSRISAALALSAGIVFSTLGEESKPGTSGPQDNENAQTTAQSQKNKREGEAFLAKNAKAQGVTVLPGGLQFRVLKEGTGVIPTTNDLVFIKYRGRRVDGTEFDHHNRFLTRMDGGIKGWQEILKRMKVGSKYEVFVPPDYGFGSEGEPAHHVDPDSTIIYELELTSIAPPNPEFNTRGLGHALDPDPQPSAPNK